MSVVENCNSAPLSLLRAKPGALVCIVFSCRSWHKLQAGKYGTITANTIGTGHAQQPTVTQSASSAGCVTATIPMARQAHARTLDGPPPQVACMCAQPKPAHARTHLMADPASQSDRHPGSHNCSVEPRESGSLQPTRPSARAAGTVRRLENSAMPACGPIGLGCVHTLIDFNGDRSLRRSPTLATTIHTSGRWRIVIEHGGSKGCRIGPIGDVRNHPSAPLRADCLHVPSHLRLPSKCPVQPMHSRADPAVA